MRSRRSISFSFFLALVTFFSNFQAFGAEPAACEQMVKFQLIDKVSMNYLGWLASPVASISDHGGGVVFWPFDEESRPTDGQWIAIGVGLANTGDVLAPSLGGIVWVKTGEQDNVKFEAGKKGGGAITFTMDEPRSCDRDFRLALDQDHQLWFDKHILGKVKDIVD
jgi:hypothetical protein